MMIIGDRHCIPIKQIIQTKWVPEDLGEHVIMKFELNTSLKFHNYNIKIENNEFFVYKRKNYSK